MNMSHRLTRTTLVTAVVALIVSVLGVTTALGGAERTYTVSVTNLTGGQPMTPFVVAAHTRSAGLFNARGPASPGLQSLAENGGVPDLITELGGTAGVGDIQATGGPVLPGDTVSVEITAGPGERWLSLAGMLICTNDGFGAIDTVKLDNSGQTRVVYGYAYDAGTEVNTESYQDLVPPCDGLGMTGMSNPALAENGVVHRHGGIQGGADLDPATHGWSGPVIEVTIEPVG